MMRYFYFYLVLTWCMNLMASPDWFFTDSDAYDGAYLNTRLIGDDVLFTFENSNGVEKHVEGVILPKNRFNLASLANHITIMPDFAMKNDMKKMLRESNFIPTTQAKPFLEKLVQILRDYLQARGEVWQN